MAKEPEIPGLGVDYSLVFDQPQEERAVRLALNPVVAYLRPYKGGYRFSSNLGPTALSVRLKRALNLPSRTFTLQSTSAAFNPLF
ncbi:hypothetical protein [Lacticaseibacillus camelliae]|uniref:Uncharacterized protein n=1 Tax=Lacticaseibacillus camelliae DSM 22697 = JCM 13995 TaxID=1423730 RepID=A0A0R2FCY7_9LACO|nr:hypothetical protein [Lacticaseibacillus camelliae]KRN25366.1 hypothetical protein FC75_GL000636 [Lacticaseibacillus camelliae DSM 22697 = JCM 13995]